MPHICPRCHSNLVAKRNLARKAVGTIGAVSGVVGGVVACAQDGGESDNLAAAVIGGMAAGLAVGIAGARLGEFVDQNLLDNYQCLRCGYLFSDGCI
ncbi:hypothetical protein EV700_1555 [Fluviicoccus keumensis]|uniref:Uncharacterized protein n=1 Tax=Fluviicoccus keumensis TaxID=1435465 RepID=A0A4Q7Z9F2_9GAMM|nr:hypothetical protein EV700_1555 [Fluviicoccus keumensis]